MLRIASFADTHAGYATYRTVDKETGWNLRFKDGIDFLKTTVDQILAEHAVSPIACVLIPGDTFHSPEPSVLTAKLVSDELSRLAQQIPTFVTAGNHETSAEINLKIPSTWLLNSIPGVTTVNQSIERLTVPGYDGVVVTAVSHQAAFEFGNELYKEVPPVAGAVNIFTGHGAAMDIEDAMLMRCAESPREVVIPEDVIYNDEWKLVALGHIHSRKTVAKQEKIFYNGSAIRRGFSDGVSDRGWTLAEINELDGSLIGVKYFTIAQRPQFDLPTVDAAGMDSKGLRDVLISNIENLQLSETDKRFLGVTDNTHIGTILRQRITGVSNQVREALDRGSVFSKANGALAYQLELPKSEHIVTHDHDNGDESVAQNLEEQRINPDSKVNVSEGFEEWAKGLGSDDFTPEQIKLAQGYIKSAWEKKLDSEQ